MKIDGRPYRTIWLAEDGHSVEVIDQTALPHAFKVARLTSSADAAKAISTMVVRGAPLIGATAAYGMALAAREDASDGGLHRAAEMLVRTRPTAVNLRWAVETMQRHITPFAPGDRADAAYAEAARICDEDVAACEAIGDYGAKVIHEIWDDENPVNILTHCNAGWLATVDWGTALAPIYKAHDAGVPIHVWVDETRPRNQGASLTAWELQKHGVPYTLIVDNAGGHLMQHGRVDLCIVGSDRTAANGDVCNKIGTYLKALAAHDNHVPFYAALPSSTIDWRLKSGEDIPIEERDQAEVTHISGLAPSGEVVSVRITPDGACAANFGFDVTPARLVTAIVTERGVCEASPEELSGLFPDLARPRPMKSLWSDADAEAMVARYAGQGVAKDLALRVYSSRLLGVEPRLVQHGGGNTSLKTRVIDGFGAEVDVLCVKGSGWDLGDIEPEGLPAVRMAPLMALRRMNSLSDEAMVDAQRGALIKSTAPNPSVETLLHAWVPKTYIDHTHANAVLALSDQPNGEALCRDLYGQRLAYVPYCMPGFALAQLAAGVFEAHPDTQGMILLKHGIFTWGDTAQEAYERMIGLVSEAEVALGAGTRAQVQVKLPEQIAPLSEIAPAIRGALARGLGDGRYQRVVLEHRTSGAALAYAGGQEVGRYSQGGTVTPDHVIRIKPWPLILPAPKADDAVGFANEVHAAVTDYADRYRAYFERHNASAEPRKTMLDPWPRWVLVPGVGLFGAGLSRKEAAIAADVAETNVEVISAAERMGTFESIPEADLFDMEYWSLEQAKLGKAKPAPLAGQVVAVTGGGGVIGAAIAKAFAAQGAEVAVLDRDGDAAERAAKAVKGLGLALDVTDADAVRAAFDRIAATYGGLDILVSNAGAAFTGAIGEVDDAVLRASFELNFFAHQSAAQAAVRIMKRQRSGGVLLFNVSKQAVNPGPDFGPYGLAKAATLALARQYAVEYGADGIRSNVVNADRIRSGLLTDEMVAARSTARGVSQKDYMSGNLLGREVTAEDVAQAFVSLALAEKTTAAVLTVDGGNIAAAMR